MGNPLEIFATGVLSAGYLIAALFFARFWRDTHDRLFGFFAAAFLLLAAQRSALVFIGPAQSELYGLLYGLRLVAFLIILYAVIDKNRAQPA